MGFSTSAKQQLNRALGTLNLQVETLTEKKVHQGRVKRLLPSGHFDRPVFPVPTGFADIHTGDILGHLPRFAKRFQQFQNAEDNDVKFSYDNDYFRSPDTEVFYLMLMLHPPATLIEIGSGNSTKVARQAIIDGKLPTRLVSIDPAPRTGIDSLADQNLRQPAEQLGLEPFACLATGDMLFIDSSHEVDFGSDGMFIYTTLLPQLRPGVLIHIHDVFLPYDYPLDLLASGGERWNEQYVLQAMLACGSRFEVIWPGYHLQRSLANFQTHFPYGNGKRAQSFWMRKL